LNCFYWIHFIINSWISDSLFLLSLLIWLILVPLQLDKFISVNLHIIYLPPFLNCLLCIARFALLPLVAPIVNVDYPYDLMDLGWRAKRHPDLKETMKNKYRDHPHKIEGVAYALRIDHDFMKYDKVEPKWFYYYYLTQFGLIQLLLLFSYLIHLLNLPVGILIVPITLLFISVIISGIVVTHDHTSQQIRVTGISVTINAVFVYISLVLEILYFQKVIPNVIGNIVLQIGFLIVCVVLIVKAIPKNRHQRFLPSCTVYLVICGVPVVFHFICLMIHHYFHKIPFVVFFIPLYWFWALLLVLYIGVMIARKLPNS
jgi:hypothetical protein